MRQLMMFYQSSLIVHRKKKFIQKIRNHPHIIPFLITLIRGQEKKTSN